MSKHCVAYQGCLIQLLPPLIIKFLMLVIYFTHSIIKHESPVDLKTIKMVSFICFFLYSW